MPFIELNKFILLFKLFILLKLFLMFHDIFDQYAQVISILNRKMSI